MHNKCLEMFEYGFWYPSTFKILSKNVIVNNGMHVFRARTFHFHYRDSILYFI